MATNVGFIVTNNGYDKITNAIAGNSTSPKPLTFKVSTDDFELRADFVASDFTNSWIEKPITNYREISENEVHFECTVDASEATSSGQSIALFFDDGTLFGYGHLLYPLGAGSDQHYDCPLLISEATSGLDFSSVPLTRAIEWDTQGSDGTNYAKFGLLSSDGTEGVKVKNDGSVVVVNMNTDNETEIGRSNDDIKDLVKPMFDRVQGFKNLIINGCLRVTQDPTTTRFDKFISSFSAADGVFSLSKSSMQGYDSAKVTIATAPSDLTTNDKFAMPFYNMMEGKELAYAMNKGKPFTLSFLFRASEAGRYYVSLRNLTDTGNTITTCTLGFDYNTSGVIQEVELHIPLYSGNAPIRNDNNLGFQLAFCFYAENDYRQSTGVNGAWYDYSGGNKEALCGTDAVGWAKVGGAYVEFARIQLEVSEIKTDFEVRPYALELELCKRYYEVKDVVHGWWYDNKFGGELEYTEKRKSPTVGFVGDTIRVHKIWLTGADTVDITDKNHPFSGSYGSTTMSVIAYDGTDNSNVDTQTGYGMIGGIFTIDARL